MKKIQQAVKVRDDIDMLDKAIVIINCAKDMADNASDVGRSFDLAITTFCDIANDLQIQLDFKPSEYRVDEHMDHVIEIMASFAEILKPTHRSFVDMALQRAFSEFITLSDTLGYDTEFIKRDDVTGFVNIGG